jgi:hypothetical protein
MSLQHILRNDDTFALDELSIMLETFTEVVADFGIREVSERERVANLIIDIAKKEHEVNAFTLRIRVAAFIRVQDEPAV